MTDRFDASVTAQTRESSE